jgi:hypothetical protein
MLTLNLWHPPMWFSLGIIALALAVSIWASLRADRRDAARDPERATPAPPGSGS